MLISIKYWNFLKGIIMTETTYSVVVGGEGQGDPNPTLCCWFEHIAADIVWVSTACCHWRVIYLCPNHNFDYPFWSILRCPRPYRGFVISKPFQNICWYFYNLLNCLLIWCTCLVQVWHITSAQHGILLEIMYLQFPFNWTSMQSMPKL